MKENQTTHVPFGYHKQDLRICSGLDHVETVLKQEGGITLLGDVEGLHVWNIDQIRQVTIRCTHFATNREKRNDYGFSGFIRSLAGWFLRKSSSRRLQIAQIWDMMAFTAASCEITLLVGTQ